MKGTRSSARDAFRAPPQGAPTTSPATTGYEPSAEHTKTEPVRTCMECNTPIFGKGLKKACSGKCRVIASRARKHAVVLEALHLAEAALVQAHEVVTALRKIADTGPHATGT